MRQFSTVILCIVLAAVVCAPATSAQNSSQAFSGEERTRSPFWSDSCEDGLVNDDGFPETGFGWTPDVTNSTYLEKVTPPAYPFQPIKVCLCWLQNQGDTSIRYDLVVYDDDGPDGKPGSLLARIPTRADGVLNFLPGSFFTVPVAGFMPLITEGSVYVGANWNPMEERGFFVCADRSLDTPQQVAFGRPFPEQEWRSLKDDLQPSYRSFLIRVDGHGRFLP